MEGRFFHGRWVLQGPEFVKITASADHFCPISTFAHACFSRHRQPAIALDAAACFGTDGGTAGGAGGLSSQNTGSFASPGSAGTVTAVVNPAVVAPPVAAVPTMETWGLLAMGALLAGFGVRRVRKQG